MVMTAGCAGWGTDGPPDPDEETDSNGEAQTNEDSENEGSDSDTDGTSDGGEEEEMEAPDDTSSTSEDETGARDSPESSDTASDTSQSDGSGLDESTDETGATENSDSQTDTDSSEGDSDDTGTAPESDESDSDSSDSPDESDGEGSSDEDDSQDDTEEDEYEYSLTVTVLEENGDPVEGESVYIGNAHTLGDEEEYVTDENGEIHFSYTGPTENEYQDFNIIVNGQETVATVYEGQNEETIQLGDTSMYLYSATVQVVDEDGNPIPNELVEIGTPGEGLNEYTTNEDGVVVIRFENSAPGDAVEQEVQVRGESHYIHVERGLQTERITVGDEERETHELTVHAGEQVGVEGVDVTIERWDGATTTKTTDEDGTATFDVYAGAYTVTGVDPRGEEQSVDVTVPDQQEVLLDSMAYPAPDEVETTLTVVDQNGDPVEGVTVEAMTSIPPHYADVYIQSEPTDENGEVAVEAHAGQNYSIDRIEDAEGDSYQVVSVGDGMTVHVDEDGESDEIVVERPTEDTQSSYAVAV